MLADRVRMGSGGGFTVSDLPVGSIVKDITWEWEHRIGDDYTGSGIIKPVTWIVVAKNHEGYPKDSTTLLSEELIGRHSFHASSMRWADSVLRLYLNYNGGILYPMNFYSAFSSSFKDMVLTTNVEVRNTTEGYPIYTTPDKVFIPAQAELGGVPGVLDIVGIDYNYFKSDSSRIAKLNGVDTFYLLRDYIRGTSNLHTVSNQGYFNYTPGPNNAKSGIRPVVNITNKTKVSKEPDVDGSYIIVY